MASGDNWLPLRGRWLRYFFSAIGVVLVLLLVLAGLPFSPLDDWVPRGAHVQAARTQIASFVAALNRYAADNGLPPTTRQGLKALITKPAVPPSKWRRYMPDLSTIPLDPWGNPYLYQSPGPQGEPFLVLSYGADGRPGGSAFDADIRGTPAGVR